MAPVARPAIRSVVDRRPCDSRARPRVPHGSDAVQLPESEWWAWVDLNYRPHAYQACALTI